MKILIVSQYFWPESFRINDLSRLLSSRGHQVSVLTGKPNYPNGKFYSGYHFLNRTVEYYHGIKVIRSPLIPRGNTKVQLAMNYLSFAFFASITGLTACDKPDIIFIYGLSPVTLAIPAIVYKRFKKVPIIFWVQDLWPDSVVAVDAIKSTILLKSLSKIVKFIYSHCDLILTTSEAYFHPIKNMGVPSSKLRYFPQSAEKVFTNIPIHHCDSEDKILPKGFRIIFSGNIGLAQDISTILTAAYLLKNYSDIKWIFLGDGCNRNILLSEIQRLQLSETVFWLGAFPLERMPKFLTCADALLVTLKDDNLFDKVLPAKIQAYFACSKPVLGSVTGVTKHVIEKAQAGLVTPCINGKELANVTLKMYCLTPQERMRMGKNAYNYFKKNFNSDILINKLEKWMEELA